MYSEICANRVLGYLRDRSRIPDEHNAIDDCLEWTQPEITFSKLTVEILEQGVKFVQS